MENNSFNKRYNLDPEIGEAMAVFMALHPPGQFPEKGDWQVLRDTSNAFYANLSKNFPIHPEVTTKDFSIKTSVGTELKLRWYMPVKKGNQSAAIVYVHGGGRVSGSLELYDAIVSNFAYLSGIPFLSVDYHLSPELKAEDQSEEVFSALTWLKSQAADLDIDENRIGIMGDSAGGGIAAATTILARNRGVRLSKQILIYPMLDDRNLIPDEQLLPFAVWTYDNNFTGWNAALGENYDKNKVSEIEAPIRLINFEGLPPTFISVGDLDIFRDENIDYASKLAKAGVAVEFYLHPNVPHGFEFVAPNATVSKKAMADYIRTIQSI